MKESRRLTAV
uniref:Uncharacterized protein n=1 Tax=Arundo donax TaxID=35708 RepID=A0A0A8YZ21_ARUDO